MNGYSIKSVSIEVESGDSSGTLIVRDALGDEQRTYIAGELPAEVAHAVLAALGLSEARLRIAALGSQGAPSRPGALRALEAPASQRSGPRSSTSTRRSAPLALADLLEELVQAVLRAGRKNPTSTVDELLESAWVAGSTHVPLLRLLSRLESSLTKSASAADATMVLSALAEFTDALRDAQGLLFAEIAGKAPSEDLEPCELLELGRRRERGSVGSETRILLDMSSGELVCETPSRPGARLSRGPVGRHLSVTLGRRILATRHRVEIQQYEYEPAPNAEHLERAIALASSGVRLPSGSGLELVAHPEPVLVQLKSLDIANQRLLCLNGVALDLEDGSCPGVTSALVDLAMSGADVDAVVGTLELCPRLGEGGSLVLVPWSAIVQSEGARRLVPLSF